MKKEASNEEINLTLNEVMLLSESLHKGASHLAEIATDMMRHRGSAITIPMSQIKELVTKSLNMSVDTFLDEIRDTRSPTVEKKPTKKAVKKAPKKKG